jgi:hypothetical protein
MVFLYGYSVRNFDLIDGLENGQPLANRRNSDILEMIGGAQTEGVASDAMFCFMFRVPWPEQELNSTRTSYLSLILGVSHAREPRMDISFVPVANISLSSRTFHASRRWPCFLKVYVDRL